MSTPTTQGRYVPIHRIPVVGTMDGPVGYGHWIFLYALRPSHSHRDAFVFVPKANGLGLAPGPHT